MLWSIDDLLLPTWVSAYLLPNQSGIQALNHLRLPAFISFSFPYHRQPQNVSRYKILLHSYTQTIESTSLVSCKSIKYSVLKLHCIKTSRKLTDLHRLYVFPFEPFLGWVFFTSNLLSSAVKAYHHYWRLRKIPILPNTRPGFRQNGAQWNNCHKWWEGIWHEIILGFTSIFHRMDTSHSIFYLYRNPAYPLIVCCFLKVLFCWMAYLNTYRH